MKRRRISSEGQLLLKLAYTNEEIIIKKEEEFIEDPTESQTPTEFKEEVKEKTRVQKLFECPKCTKKLTKKH